jgi:4'-phosphopantetheinyl transferase
MGLIYRNEVCDDVLLGIWRITEDYDTLYSAVKLLEDEEKTLSGFHSYQRKLEWLSVRVLINTLLEREAWIVYNKDRKPFLHDNSYYISISHSNELTSILLSRTKKVGIDLEYMSHQIDKVSQRFIHENENITKNPELRRTHLYIHWCAKEALYKICDKQDIIFTQNLFIEPFEVAPYGTLKGWVDNRLHHELFEVNYFEKDNYIIAWCCK